MLNVVGSNSCLGVSDSGIGSRSLQHLPCFFGIFQHTAVEQGCPSFLQIKAPSQDDSLAVGHINPSAHTDAESPTAFLQLMQRNDNRWCEKLYSEDSNEKCNQLCVRVITLYLVNI